MTLLLHLQAWGLYLNALCMGQRHLHFRGRVVLNQCVCPHISGTEDLARDFIAIWFGNNFTLEKVKTFIWHL